MKVGVNFPVTGTALRACCEFNAGLMSLTKSRVSFGPSGNSSPHVTIAMGTLRDSEMLGRLEAAVTRAMSAFPDCGSPPTMSFGPVYREDLTGHYVFADAQFSEQVQRWRTETQNRLDAFFAEPARTTDIPHLTLGHISDGVERVDAFISTSRPTIPKCGILSVDISVSGSKGIKQSVLRNLSLVR